MIGAVLVLSGFFVGLWLHWVAVFVAVALVIVWRLLAQMFARDGRTYGAVLGDVLIAGFIQLYVPFLTSLCLILLRQDGGEWWVLAFIIIAVASDTGAYAAGLSFGKHPMAPKISPKKTWEGFAGAAPRRPDRRRAARAVHAGTAVVDRTRSSAPSSSAPPPPETSASR